MKAHIVEVIAQRRQEGRIPSPDSFTLRADLKHVWLQKAALWVLAKLGARALDRTVEFTRHVVDTNDVLTKLTKAHAAVRQSINREPTIVLIGVDDYAELIGTPKIHAWLQFDAEYKVHGPKGLSIMGMRVCIVPWMQGVLPVPAQMLSACVARPAR